MPRNNPPSQRNRLDFVLDGTKRGDVVSWAPLFPKYVTELEDGPDLTRFGPVKRKRRLPGVRAALTLSGCPFEFIVRVVLDDCGDPQVVDLRIRSPHDLGDVPITNADLKSVSVAALALAARHPQFPGLEVTHDDHPQDQVVRRPGRLGKVSITLRDRAGGLKFRTLSDLPGAGVGIMPESATMQRIGCHATNPTRYMFQRVPSG